MERKSWTEQQNLALKNIVQEVGLMNWTLVAARLSQTCLESRRTGKQCRQRWINHLDRSISKKPWSKSEQKIIFQMHNIHGNKWKQIAKYMKARYMNNRLRTQSDIKNHFYATMRKGIRRLNKLLGFSKNPSSIRQIKPRVMSKVCEQVHLKESQKSSNQQIPGVFTLLLELSRCEPSLDKCDELIDYENLIKEAQHFLDRLLEQKYHQLQLSCRYKDQKLAKSSKKQKQASKVQEHKSEQLNNQFDISQYLCLGDLADIDQIRPKSQGAPKDSDSIFSQSESQLSKNSASEYQVKD